MSKSHVNGLHIQRTVTFELRSIIRNCAIKPPRLSRTDVRDYTYICAGDTTRGTPSSDFNKNVKFYFQIHPASSSRPSFMFLVTVELVFLRLGSRVVFLPSSSSASLPPFLSKSPGTVCSLRVTERVLLVSFAENRSQ